MKLSPFSEHIITVIQDTTHQPVIFRHISPEHGGSINESFKIETSAGNFFLKKNSAAVYLRMFEKEISGLQLLKKSEMIHTPEIIAQGVFESEQYLILRFMEKGQPGKTFWEDFGRGMAELHKNTSDKFGLSEDNFIGSLQQNNAYQPNWGDFFIHNRLRPLVEMAFNHKKLNRSQEELFLNLYKKIPDYFPNEKPALLHGDFWNGNFMADVEGNPIIFDPAVYYGHREMDIAMSMLFGGFNEKFYASYQESFPLENGWKERIKIANLYPLLVHVNLFGGNYIAEVEATLKSFQ